MTNLYFKNASFEFETRAVLGNIHYGSGDIGEVVSTVATIEDGNASDWVDGWRKLATRVQCIAAQASGRGHRVSARNAYLRAAAYFAAAQVFVDGIEEADEALKTLFASHRHCFDAHVGLLDPPATQVAVPYEGSSMPGYFFVPADDGQARPTIILCNGSDGAVTSLWPAVAQPALDRGYNALIFDGPGQQKMLFDYGVPFRPDWEHVISPIVDFLIERTDVDTAKLAIYGLSQGGYWVPRALAFEHRIAAAVLDPGVDDVFTSWRANLPDEMLELLDAGDEERFNANMDVVMESATPQERQTMEWRIKPYGSKPSAFATIKGIEQYRLGDLVSKISTPVLVTNPDGEQFWPGQSERLFDSLREPKVLVPFTNAEGADMHCEPMGRALLEQRMYDWLDDTLKVSSPEQTLCLD
jgi:hypothetical protein